MAPRAPRASEGEQYFEERPRSASSRHELRFLFRGELLTFLVDRSVFSSHGLDPGTALLIENLDLAPTDRVLDLGCGWGAIGIAAAKTVADGHVILTDINRRASYLARLNVERNRVANAEVRTGSLFDPVRGERFDVIAVNPPFHAGRELILELLSEAAEHLQDSGRILLVGKGSQGILFYQRWMSERWRNEVRVLDRRSGYRVLEARPGREARHA